MPPESAFTYGLINISTATAVELARAHAQCSQGYVAAPVFGNPDAAKMRDLFIIAAGATADIERCQRGGNRRCSDAKHQRRA